MQSVFNYDYSGASMRQNRITFYSNQKAIKLYELIASFKIQYNIRVIVHVGLKWSLPSVPVIGPYVPYTVISIICYHDFIARI